MGSRAAEREPIHTSERTEGGARPLISFVRRALIVIGLIALTALVAGILWYTIELIMVAFAGVLLAVGLRGVSDWVAGHTRLSSGWSLALVSLTLFVLLALGTALFATTIFQQVDQFREQLPQSVQEARQRAEQLPGGNYLVSLFPEAGGQGGGQQGEQQGGQQQGGQQGEQQAGGQQGAQQGGGQQSPVANGIVTFFSTTLGVLTNIVIIVVLGLYFASESRMYIDGVVRLFPKPRRDRARTVMGTLGYTLRWWLLGQLLSMVVVGVVTAVGLLLLGVPFAPLLGLLSGLLEFVPTVGPIIAAVPGLLLAFGEGTTTGLLALGLYVVVQTLEGYLLYPMIQERVVKLPPALTILALAMMGVLLGPLGLLLATPLLAVVLSLVKMLYVEDVLGDHLDVPGEPA
jgi:predicted PurR-regulated permease PerM